MKLQKLGLLLISTMLIHNVSVPMRKVIQRPATKLQNTLRTSKRFASEQTVKKAGQEIPSVAQPTRWQKFKYIGLGTGIGTGIGAGIAGAPLGYHWYQTQQKLGQTQQKLGQTQQELGHTQHHLQQKENLRQMRQKITDEKLIDAVKSLDEASSIDDRAEDKKEKIKKIRKLMSEEPNNLDQALDIILSKYPDASKWFEKSGDDDREVVKILLEGTPQLKIKADASRATKFAARKHDKKLLNYIFGNIDQTNLASEQKKLEYTIDWLQEEQQKIKQNPSAYTTEQKNYIQKKQTSTQSKLTDINKKIENLNDALKDATWQNDPQLITDLAQAGATNILEIENDLKRRNLLNQKIQSNLQEAATKQETTVNNSLLQHFLKLESENPHELTDNAKEYLQEVKQQSSS